MLFRVTNLRTPLDVPESDLMATLARKLRIQAGDLQSVRIQRKSLDARQRNALQFEYSLIVQTPTSQMPAVSGNLRIEPFQPKLFHDPDPGTHPMLHRPVVVGSGPAGLMAGYYLAIKGFRPIILERGKAVKDRVPAIRSFDAGGDHDQENNYLFGEGGAGCFSDGKLTCRITGPDVDWVLQSFVDCGGRASLTYEHRPHLGSNKLPLICRNFRRKIEALGGEYRFDCRMEGLSIGNEQLTAIQTSSGEVRTDHCVLAMGHSARDTYTMLLTAGLPLRPKAFQLGVRIEQPQAVVNEHKYGRPEYLTQLGAADYSLVAKGQRDLFSFCMCAGGIVIPSVSESSMFCSNGMSNSRHDSTFANSGLVVTLEPALFGSPHPLAGVELQRQCESAAFELAGRQYLAPIQRATDFLDGRTPSRTERISSSYSRGTYPMNLATVLPPPVLQAIRNGLPIMDKKWNGKYLPEAVLVGPETRGSSPVRIDRDRHTWQIPGLGGVYPVGEGAGYAGGIVTAAVDGLRAARKIVETFAPPNAC